MCAEREVAPHSWASRQNDLGSSRFVEIARRLSLSVPHVGRTRKRFVEGDIEGPADQPKARRRDDVPEEIVGEMVATVMSPFQAGYSRWSIGELKWKVGVDKQVILTIMKANDREPHRQRAFKGSRDVLFEEKVQNVVRLSLNRPLSDRGR